jgi:zinc protease
MQTLTEPAFAQDRIDLAKRTARQGLERRNDSVTSIAQYQMGFLLFGENHFAGRADITAASLEALTREDLLVFHHRLLHPSNLVVSVSGKFNRKALLERLNATLGTLKAGPDAQVSPKVPTPDFQRKPAIYLVNKVAPQAMVEWAFPGLRRTDPDWHAATVMNHILGGSFTSRLMKRIRSDEGLTYGVRTSLGEGPHYRGDLRGSLQTKNRSVAQALRIALAEMQRLKDETISETELKAIKDGLIESFPSQWSGKQATASRFAAEALAGWPEDWWSDFSVRIQAVKPVDVQRLARQLLVPERMVILAVGQASEVEQGDPDHPGALPEVVKLPYQRLPLRDPQTNAPMK